MRRSFRLGLRLGLLIGVVAALVKIMQARRSADEAAGAGWGGSDTGWTPPAAPPSTSDRIVAPSALADAPPPAEVAVLEEVSETLPAGVVAPGLVEEELVSPPPVAPRAAPAPPAKKAAKAAARPAAKAAKAPAPAAAQKPPKKRAARAPAPAAWVEPSGATCPPSHPVKAKLSSRLFQLPGMFAYDRTRPDRCYVDEAAATGDGFTRAKR